MLSKEDIERSLPTSVKINITDEFVEMFNNLSDNPIIAEALRKNFITYSNVINEGTYKVSDYLNAIKYMTYKYLEYSNKDAFKLTFPERYKDLIANGVSDKDISSYVAMYNKNKLVNLLKERFLIPVHILYSDVYHKAIQTQADLMITAKSDKVKCDAANSLLTHLKRPETKQIELQIGAKDSTDIRDLKDTIRQLAKVQMEQITNGSSSKDVARQQIIDITPKETI